MRPPGNLSEGLARIFLSYVPACVFTHDQDHLKKSVGCLRREISFSSTEKILPPFSFLQHRDDRIHIDVLFKKIGKLIVGIGSPGRDWLVHEPFIRVEVGEQGICC